MIYLLAPALLLSSLTEARVTFTHSEVLQASDIPLPTNRAPFKCTNGCYAFTTSHSDQLAITKYNKESDEYEEITTFANMGGVSHSLPEPFKLEDSDDYFIENYEQKNPFFVFYVVNNDAENIGTPVMVVDHDEGIDGNGLDHRMITVLNANFNAVRYKQIEGTFDLKKGFPRIYSTGFDAASEDDCQAVYLARTQEGALLADIVVYSPISTIDFGYKGKHNVHVQWFKPDEHILCNSHSSAVFSSPGYVGCSYNNGQLYSSLQESIEEGCILVSNGLDVSAIYDEVSENETVTLRVDEIVLDFSGTGSVAKQYPMAFEFYIEVMWERTTPTSSWAVQIDFDTLSPLVTEAAVETTSESSRPNAKTDPTTTTTKSSVPQSTSVPSTEGTTSSGQIISLFSLVIVSILTLY